MEWDLTNQSFGVLIREQCELTYHFTYDRYKVFDGVETEKIVEYEMSFIS